LFILKKEQPERYGMSIITFLSDYGLESSTVGAIKGVLLKHAPHVNVIDFTHLIRPQDLLMARFELMTAYNNFPKDTVHLAIVDPGSEAMTRGVAFRTADYFFVGPDNGLFDGVLDLEPALDAVELVTPSVPYRPFRGRDVFAPAAAALASGAELASLGASIAPDSLARISVDLANYVQSNIHGEIQFIDRFGNLITNIPGDWVKAKTWEVNVAGHHFSFRSDGQAKNSGKLKAQVASHGFLQLIFEGDNCARKLGVETGQLVVLNLS
jgi:S-adenosyl-L-methionine hydrolase (adenosine-forming)